MKNIFKSRNKYILVSRINYFVFIFGIIEVEYFIYILLTLVLL